MVFLSVGTTQKLEAVLHVHTSVDSLNEKVHSRKCQKNEDTSVVDGQGRPVCLENETVFSVVCWYILVLKIW